jgi:N-acetylmuramoyl-L-alanine amidase
LAIPRDIDLIVIHCADTPANMDIGVKEIDRWHRQRGWLGIGYHYVIRRNGKVEYGRDLSKVGAHAEGFNAHSIGICMVGGCKMEGDKQVPENNFTPEQWATLEKLVLRLLIEYPKCKVVGHNDLTDKKACPSFKVAQWLESLVKIKA